MQNGDRILFNEGVVSMQSRQDTVKRRQEEREARLAEQLRANLKRRKTQAKSRTPATQNSNDVKK